MISIHGVIVLLVLGVAWARAQQPPPSAPIPAPSPVIARIEGRPIHQDEFDRIGRPYFDQLRAQMKAGFTELVQQHANYNVLSELIRREVLVVEAQRQKTPVGEVDTDRILHQDPFFQTNGKFDPGKYLQYKINPASNYMAVLPRIRELAAAGKLDSLTRARLTPSLAEVRAEWSKRNDQVRFKFLHLALRDMPLQEEATPEEWAAYYEAHPAEFERKPRVRLRYLGLPLPPEGDSSRTTAESEARARASRLADSLRLGFSIDSLAAAPGEVRDTGPFDVAAPVIPGLGRVPEIATAVAGADSDTTIRVVGPVVVSEMVLVGVVSERFRRMVPPLREVLADVKRKADDERRKTTLEAEKRAFYEGNPGRFRTARASLTRVLLSEAALSVRGPAARDEERWYLANGRSLAPLAEGGALPALNDSLRGIVRERILEQSRAEAAARALAGVATGWRAGRDVRSLARAARATVETLTVTRGGPPDTLFSVALTDSLIDEGARGAVGVLAGPRRFSERWVLWRVESGDSAFVPEFATARARVDREYADHKRLEEEEEARIHYEAHRGDYKTKPKFVLDYIAVRILSADSMNVPEAELRASYQKNLDSYREEEQVRARHILISNRPDQTPGGDPIARRRADSLLVALRAGANFEELARLFSQDTGSGMSGGDLGYFPRARMVKEFSDTAFTLVPGRVSDPVKTSFGYHLIRVDEKKPARVRPFDEVQFEIQRTLGSARADSSALRAANGLRRQFARGAAVAVAAAPHGGVTTSPPLAANETIPGLGIIQGLAQELDSLKVGRWAPKAYRAGGAYVLVRVAQRIPPGPAEFSEARAKVVDDLRNAKRRARLDGKVAALRAGLGAGAALDSLAAPYGGLKESGPVGRNAGFVPYLGAEPRVVSRAFSLSEGASSDTIATAQGVAWIQLDQKTTSAGASFAKDRPGLTLEMATQRYTEWVERKKKAMRIEILRPDLREKPKAITQTFSVDGGSP